MERRKPHGKTKQMPKLIENRSAPAENSRLPVGLLAVDSRPSGSVFAPPATNFFIARDAKYVYCIQHF
jgi:hypothetical protein